MAAQGGSGAIDDIAIITKPQNAEKETVQDLNYSTAALLCSSQVTLLAFLFLL